MSNRPYNKDDYLALKAAFDCACKDIGTLDQSAGYTRVNISLLSKYGNPEQPEFPPIDVALDMDAASGGDRILRAWAALRGYELTRVEKGVSVESMTRHIGAIGKETGELINEMCSAISDGKVTPAEASLIEGEIETLIDNLMNLQRDCRRIRAG